jgi:hypothetical protein
MGTLINMLFLSYTDIIHWLQAHQLPCFWKAIFHIDCPGCGFQRSFIALLQGRLLESIQLYPALILILFYTAFLIIQKKIKAAFLEKWIKPGYIFIFIVIFTSYIIKLINQN